MYIFCFYFCLFQKPKAQRKPDMSSAGKKRVFFLWENICIKMGWTNSKPYNSKITLIRAIVLVPQRRIIRLFFFYFPCSNRSITRTISDSLSAFELWRVYFIAIYMTSSFIFFFFRRNTKLFQELVLNDRCHRESGT